MRHPIGWAFLVLMVVLGSTSWASSIIKKTTQEKARQADLVFIARVQGLQDSGQRTRDGFEKWIADCTVTEIVLGGLAASDVRVELLLNPKDDNPEMPEEDRLEPGKSYILFLKQTAGQVSLIAPWDSSMEVAEHYDVWDEDLKDDEEAIRGSACIINGVPLVTVTHADIVRKIRATAKQEKPKLIWREDAGIRLEQVETAKGFTISPQQAAGPMLARMTLAPWGVPYLFADVKYYYFGVADNRKPFPDVPGDTATRIDGMTGEYIEPEKVDRTQSAVETMRMGTVRSGKSERQAGLAQRELSMATLQAIDTGAIEFEERGGEILVTVVDRFKDAHLFTLKHEPYTREQALEILKIKREDLQRQDMMDGVPIDVVPEPEIKTFMEKVRAEDFHGMWQTGMKVFVAGRYVPEHAKLFKDFPVQESEPGTLRYDFYQAKGEAGAGSISMFMEKGTGKIIMFSPVEATF